MKLTVLACLFLVGCASQPEYRTMRYEHSNGKVEYFTYRVPSTPGYVAPSDTTVYKDSFGGVIGYGVRQ